MLQAHSWLWHYLWIAPNLLLLVLALAVWKRSRFHHFPAFLCFSILASFGQLTLYAADITPAVTPQLFWRIDWGTLILEGILKFVVIGEIFACVYGPFASIARLGRILIRAVGATLVLAAALAAAYAPKGSIFGIISGAHLLEQTIYLIETGLLVFIFGLGIYFHLALDRAIFGISLGFGFSACVHLAVWALLANGELPNDMRQRLDFANMFAYHFCVLIWFYYLLVPGKVVAKSAVPLPENNLEVWNRELERLLQP